jgi:ribosome-associated toxin RatA of RatAB toxin-antitoxin module
VLFSETIVGVQILTNVTARWRTTTTTTTTSCRIRFRIRFRTTSCLSRGRLRR